MDDLLLRRRQMMAAAMPYDSVVGYLESDGGQYITTGVTLDWSKDFVIHARIALRGNSNRCVIIGSYEDGVADANCFSLEIYNNPTNSVRIFTRGNGYNKSTAGTTSFTAGPDIDIIASYDHTAKTITVTASEPTASLSDTFTVDVSSTASGVNVRPLRLFLDWRANTSAIAYPLRLRRPFGGLYVIVDGRKVLDYMPVRVGTVGYMYDYVTGALKGNEGTGAFTLGPDA